MTATLPPCFFKSRSFLLLFCNFAKCIKASSKPAKRNAKEECWFNIIFIWDTIALLSFSGVPVVPLALVFASSAMSSLVVSSIFMLPKISLSIQNCAKIISLIPPFGLVFNDLRLPALLRRSTFVCLAIGFSSYKVTISAERSLLQPNLSFINLYNSSGVGCNGSLYFDLPLN